MQLHRVPRGPSLIRRPAPPPPGTRFALMGASTSELRTDTAPIDGSAVTVRRVTSRAADGTPGMSSARLAPNVVPSRSVRMMTTANSSAVAIRSGRPVPRRRGHPAQSAEGERGYLTAKVACGRSADRRERPSPVEVSVRGRTGARTPVGPLARASTASAAQSATPSSRCDPRHLGCVIPDAELGRPCALDAAQSFEHAARAT